MSYTADGGKGEKDKIILKVTMNPSACNTSSGRLYKFYDTWGSLKMVNMVAEIEKEGEAEVCVAILITESDSDGVPVSHHLSVCLIQGAGIMNLP